jgi:hypothetical protein
MTSPYRALRRRLVRSAETVTQRLAAPSLEQVRAEIEREAQARSRELDEVRTALRGLRAELDDIDARQWDQTAISHRLAEIEDSLSPRDAPD